MQYYACDRPFFWVGSGQITACNEKRIGMHKLRVGVLMGGRSHEYEVSFNSGRTVCDHLDRSLYDVLPIFQTQKGHLYLLPLKFLYRGKTTDFMHRLADEADRIEWDNLTELIDFAFIAMHGQYAEDGRLQGLLHMLKIPYLGSKVLASALCINKVVQKRILKSHNIDVAQAIDLEHEVALQILHDSEKLEELHQALIERNITFPLIIKPACEGSSIGVTSASAQHELKAALKNALDCCSVPQPILIEEKLDGMEFSCVCLTDASTGKLYALPPTEIIPQGSGIFSYNQKYMPGLALKFTPARCSAYQQKLIRQACVKAAESLHLSNFCRIDGFLTNDNRVVIVDPNSIPGMGPSSFLFREAAEIGMNHNQVINHLIETELVAYTIPLPGLNAEKENLMFKEKLRVAVILGGGSNEREISLESGRNIVYKLAPSKYEVLPLFLTRDLILFKLSQQQLVGNSTAEITSLLRPQDRVAWHELPAYADFVFIALHGGEGENGCIQGTLEMLHIPYNGSSVLTSALCINKHETNRFLRARGFESPKGYLLAKKEYAADIEKALEHILKEIPLPVIIKPHDDGCSFMVNKAENKQELADALDRFFRQDKQFALIEECISGMELTVGCIGNEQAHALPPSKIVSASSVLSLEEKFLPGAGENQTPAPLPAQTLRFIQDQVEQIYSAVNCKGYARIDCFYQTAEQSPTGHERVVCIEINTLPGMTPATVLFHQAAELGISPAELIDQIIEMGRALHTRSATFARNNYSELDDAFDRGGVF